MGTSSGSFLVFGAFTAIALSPATALAEEDPSNAPVTHERRAGVVLGAAGGPAFGGASGYPNNDSLQGDPAYYSETPLLVGYATSFFVMGALTDYLSFGPLLNLARFDTPDWSASGWALGFRADLYPLVSVAKKWGYPFLADTALYAQAGFGAAELHAKGPYPSSDGAQSFLGLGLHQELRLTRLFGGHLAAGPYLEYDAIRSTPAEQHWLTAGLRVAWYGGSVGLDAAR